MIDKLIYNKNNNRFFNFYNSLLLKNGIKINTDYEFVFYDFLEHLTTDTDNFILKNLNSNINLNNHKRDIFSSIFYNHIYSNEWVTKLFNPERCAELIKIVRNKKLNKIENGSR